MATEIRVPSLGESVVEATVGQWFKQTGDTVAADEPLVELETDKVTVEVPAPASGVLAEERILDTVVIVLSAACAKERVAAAGPCRRPGVCTKERVTTGRVIQRTGGVPKEGIQGARCILLTGFSSEERIV